MTGKQNLSTFYFPQYNIQAIDWFSFLVLCLHVLNASNLKFSAHLDILHTQPSVSQLILQLLVFTVKLFMSCICF